MAETSEPLIKIAVGPDQPDLILNTMDDLEQFVLREVEYWRFLEPLSVPASDSYRAYVKGIWERIAGLQTTLAQYQTDTTNYFGAMRKGVARLYGQASDQLPASHSIEGAMLKGFARELSPGAFCIAFQYVVRQGQVDGLTLANPNHLQALTAVANGRLGVTSNAVQAHATALQAMHGQYSQLMGRDLERQDQATATWLQFSKDADDQLQRRLRNSAEALTQAKDSGVRQLDEVLRRVESLEQTLKEKLRLEAPTRYWDEKRIGHRKRAVWYGRVCLLFALTVVVFGFVSLGEAYNYALGLPITTHISVYLLLAAKGLIVFIVAFWVARILVRRYLSELHLATDAQERQTMVMTYLALTETGKVTEVERALVLQPLFRSTADGIVKDDGSTDPILAALLARATSVRV
jgi:hypothetical protein